MASTPESASVHVDGNMGLLRERVSGQPENETRFLLSQLLNFAERHHLTANSDIQENAQHGHLRINLGLAKDTRIPAWQPESLVDCEVVINVRKTLRLGELYPSQTPAALLVGAADGPTTENAPNPWRLPPSLISSLLTAVAEVPVDNPSRKQLLKWLSEPIPVSEHQNHSDLGRQSSAISPLAGQTSSAMSETNSQPELMNKQSSSFHFSRSVSVNTSPAVNTGAGIRNLPLSQATVQSQSSYASYESYGQASQQGSRWPGGLTPNRNSGFASGSQSSVPKEGNEIRRKAGTVGRVGNAPREVPPALAAAARSQQTIQFTPGSRADLHTEPQTGFESVFGQESDTNWDPFYLRPIGGLDFEAIEAELEAMDNQLESDLMQPMDVAFINYQIGDFEPAVDLNADARSVRDPELAQEPKLLPIIEESGEDAEDHTMAEGPAVSPARKRPRTSGDPDALATESNPSGAISDLSTTRSHESPRAPSASIGTQRTEGSAGP